MKAMFYKCSAEVSMTEITASRSSCNSRELVDSVLNILSHVARHKASLAVIKSRDAWFLALVTF